MSGLTQRKRAGGTDLTTPTSEYANEQPASGSTSDPNSQTGSNENLASTFQADADGFTDQDLVGKKVKLTLMEEIMLIGIRDEQGWYSWWNENMSYVLRGCMLAELAMRGRIGIFKEAAGRHHRKPYYDRLIDVISDEPTGEVLLDEALKIMKMEQSSKPPERHSISEWIDLLSGETWNLMKYSYQMKLVRERLSKGLVDKGVLRTEKKNFVIFEMTTHPVTDAQVKAEIVQRISDSLVGVGLPPTRRTIALICATYAANILDNALSNSNMLKRSLSFSEKDKCFAKCEDMLAEWSKVQQMENGAKPVPDQTAFSDMTEKSKLGWNDVLYGVVGVFHKMDSML